MESKFGLKLTVKENIIEHFNLASINRLLIFNFINFREILRIFWSLLCFCVLLPAFSFSLTTKAQHF